MEQAPNLLTLDAVANLLKVGVPTVQSLINRGFLIAQTHQGQTLVSCDAMVRFLRDDQRHVLEEDGQAPELGLIAGGNPETSLPLRDGQGGPGIERICVFESALPEKSCKAGSET
jgi:hypothetical protein